MGIPRRAIHRGLLLAYSAGFIGWAAYRARSMRLWFDELITVHLAMLPEASQIWRALEAQADGIPPLSHLIARALFAATGPSELAARLPSVVGVWAMTLCLFAFVARRCGPSYGWVALLLPLATPVAPYAYEARPYGIVLGLAGLALLAWRAATASGWRRAAGVPGLALCLALAVVSHYYAVLLFFPLALGELARTIERRRVDPWVWLAMAAGAAPLVAFVPLARALSATFGGNYFGRPSASSLPDAYASLLGPAAPALVVVVLAYGWHGVRPPRPDDAPPPGYGPPPWREYVLAAGFAALPAVAFAMAVLATGAWVERYILPSCLGFGILAAFALHRLARGRPGPARVAAAALLVAAVANFAADAREQSERFAPPAALAFPLRFAPDAGGPIVVSYPDLYYQLVHYGPKALRPRLLYVSDGVNTAELILERLPPFAPVQVAGFRPFWEQQADGRFLLYGRADDWLVSTLVARGARMELHYLHGTTFVASVTGPLAAPDRPPAASSRGAPAGGLVATAARRAPAPRPSP